MLNKIFPFQKTMQDSDLYPLFPARHRIWAIGGGKGGVGKSLITCNFGVLLSRIGKKVLLIDGDVGAANLHTLLGSDGGKCTLSSFIKGEIPDIRPLIHKTYIPRLDLISGAKDITDVADLGGAWIERLKKALNSLEYEYILLDLGPGTSSNILDLFLVAEEGILVTTPDPTSVENSYRFLKSIFLRQIKRTIDYDREGILRDLLKGIFGENGGFRSMTIADIRAQLRRMDTKYGLTLEKIVGSTNISIVINQVKKSEDQRIGHLMGKACQDYFGVRVECLGHICYEDCAGDSIRYRRPLVVHYTHSEAAKAVVICLNQMREIEKRRLDLAPMQMIRKAGASNW